MTIDKPANAKIRKAMIDAGMTQKELAQILEMSEPALSIMLRHELSGTVQRDFIARIKEARG